MKTYSKPAWMKAYRGVEFDCEWDGMNVWRSPQLRPEEWIEHGKNALIPVDFELPEELDLEP